MRFKAHETQSVNDWTNFRDVRNKCKQTIKYTRKTFFKKALSSERAAEVWTFIHRILNPKRDKICVNGHHVSTANRISNTTATSQIDLLNHINNFELGHDCAELYFRHVTYSEVET